MKGRWINGFWVREKESVKCRYCLEVFDKNNPGSIATHVRFRHKPNPPKVGRKARVEAFKEETE